MGPACMLGATVLWCFAVSWCCRHKCWWFKERAVGESPVSCHKVSFLCLPTTGLNFSPAAFFPVPVTGDGCRSALGSPGAPQLCGHAATQTSGGTLVFVTPLFLSPPTLFKMFWKGFIFQNFGELFPENGKAAI